MPIGVFQGPESELPSGFGNADLELDSTFLDVAVSGFSRESDIVGDIYNAMNEMPAASPDDIAAVSFGKFSALDYLGEDHPYNTPQLRSKYAGLLNPAQVDWQVAKHDREAEQLRHLENSPVMSIPFELAGGLFSKATLIEAGLFGGLPATIGKRMLMSAGYSSATTGMQEWWLHGQQDMRTWQETAFGMAGGVGITSTIAGMTGRFKSSMPKTELGGTVDKTTLAANTIPETRPSAGYDPQIVAPEGTPAPIDIDPVRAQAIMDNPNLTETQKQRAIMDMKGEKYKAATPLGVVVGTLGGLTKYINPDVKMATSNWITMQRFSGNSVDHAVDTVGKLDGQLEVPLDVRMRQHDTFIDVNINNIVDDGYTKYITGKTGKMAKIRTAMRRNKPLTKAEFHNGIRDDITSGFKSPDADPVMREAAQNLYKEVIEPVGRDLVRLGHLDGDANGMPLPPKGDELWFPRGWNVQHAKMTDVEEWIDGMIEPHMKGLRRSMDATDSQHAVEVEQMARVYRDRTNNVDARLASQQAEIDQLKAAKASKKEIKARRDQHKSEIESIRRAAIEPRFKEYEAALRAKRVPIAKSTKPLTKAETKRLWARAERDHDAEMDIMRKELATKMKGNPKTMEWLEAQTPEGLAKIRERYAGMHKKLIDGSDMGDRFDLNISNKKWLAGTTGGNVKLVQSRSLDVATVDAPEGYLEANPMMTLSYALKRQQRTMDVEADPRFGDATFKNWNDELKAERDLKRAEINEDSKLSPEQKRKARAKLEKDFNKQKDYMRKTVQALYDIRKPPEHLFMHQLGQSMKSLAVLNQLGSVITSVLPETVAPVSHVGFRGVAKHIAGWALDPAMMKEMTRQQKAHMLVGVQTGQAARIAEHGDYEFGMGKVVEKLHKTTDFAIDKAYMLGVWTRMAASQTGGMVQSAWGASLAKANWSKGPDGELIITGIKKRDLEDLGRAGISREQLPAIIDNVKKHGERVAGGGYVLNMKDKNNDWIWDREAGETLQRAIFGAVNNIIIKPSTASVPFISRTMMGSVSMQFKNFMMASTSKYFLADMQKIFRGDMRGMERQLAFFSTGLAVTALKADLYGKDTADWDEGKWFRGALNNGGGVGIGAELLSFLEENLMGGSTRYMGNRTPLGMVIGPAPQMAEDMLIAPMNLIRGIKNGDLKRSHFEDVARGIPGNNFVGMRFLGIRDAIIDKGYDTFGSGEE